MPRKSDKTLSKTAVLTGYQSRHFFSVIQSTSNADMSAEIDRRIDELEKLGDGRTRASVVSICPWGKNLGVLFEYSIPVYKP